MDLPVSFDNNVQNKKSCFNISISALKLFVTYLILFYYLFMAKKYFSGIVKGVFRFFNRLRLFIINIVFWGILLAFAVLLFHGELAPDVQEKTVLKVKLSGYLVEQYSGGYQSGIEDIVSENGEILLRDVKEAIDYASSDDRITSIFLDLSGFRGGGLSKIQETGKSLEKFRNKGKKIICYSDKLDNSSYYLASRADSIVLDPLGEVRLRGFSSYRNYYRKGLDKFSIKMNIFKAGDYKSAVDPFRLDKMSENDREAVARLYDRIIRLYADELAEGRGISRNAVFDYMKNYHNYLRKTGGEGSLAALNSSLVDSLGDYDSAYGMIDEVEEIDWREYLKVAVKSRGSSESKIAVITASGMILDGEYEPGKIGSDTFRKLFEKAADDTDIKAVVSGLIQAGGAQVLLKLSGARF